MDLEQQLVVEYVRAQRLFVDYVHVAVATLLYYEWLIQLQSEISFIWKSDRWGYTKILYFLVRYIPLGSVCFLLYIQLFVNSAKECAWAIPIWLVSTDLVLMMTELILVIRTWAVWKRDRRVGLALGLMWIVILALSLVTDISFLKGLQVLPGPYPGFRGCRIFSSFSVKKSGDRTAVGMIVLDTVMLVLMSISALRSYRMNRLSHVIHRDGILGYFYLEVVMIVSYVSIMAFPEYFDLMMEPLKSACYSVFTTRIIINMRKENQRDIFGDSVELHTRWDEETNARITMPMEFSPVEDTRNFEGDFSP